MVSVKAQAEEAEANWITEEKIAAAAGGRCRAVLAMMETAPEEAQMEQDGRSPLKQRGGAEGEQRVCNHCAMWGCDCQVSQFVCFSF